MEEGADGEAEGQLSSLRSAQAGTRGGANRGAASCLGGPEEEQPEDFRQKPISCPAEEEASQIRACSDPQEPQQEGR